MCGSISISVIQKIYTDKLILSIINHKLSTDGQVQLATPRPRFSSWLLVSGSFFPTPTRLRDKKIYFFPPFLSLSLSPGGDDWASRCALRPSPFGTSSPYHSPAASTHQVCPPLLFPSCRAKRSTPNPNLSYLYSDLTQLQVYACIIPTRTSILLQKLSDVHPCPKLGSVLGTI